VHLLIKMGDHALLRNAGAKGTKCEAISMSNVKSSNHNIEPLESRSPAKSTFTSMPTLR